MNPNSKILWEWKASESERVVRVIISYMRNKYYKPDYGSSFWKDITYEISDGYNAMDVLQYKMINEKEMVEHIIDKAYYFGWKKVLESFFKAIDNEMD